MLLSLLPIYLSFVKVNKMEEPGINQPLTIYFILPTFCTVIYIIFKNNTDKNNFCLKMLSLFFYYIETSNEARVDPAPLENFPNHLIT